MAGLGVLPWVCLFGKWVLISCGYGCFVVGLGIEACACLLSGVRGEWTVSYIIIKTV